LQRRVMYRFVHFDCSNSRLLYYAFIVPRLRITTVVESKQLDR
jgi:hypothetical protein